jgi:biotin carboxyl carrier protein
MNKPDQSLDDSHVRVEINNRSTVIDLDTDGSSDSAGFSVEHINGDKWSVLHNGMSISVTLTDHGKNTMSFSVNGVIYDCRITNRRAQLLADLGVDSDQTDHSGDISAPMPGLVVKLNVAVGDTVAAGDAIIVLEAMKMENEIRAPFDARVAGISVNSGESVSKNATLITLEHV